MAAFENTAARPAPATPARFIDPSTMPNQYAVPCVGNCLEPVFTDGTCLAFSRLVRPIAGDFVVLWFRPERIKPGHPFGQVKRLAMDLPDDLALPLDRASWGYFEPIVTVEMLNPAKRWSVPASHLLAIHTVIGVAEQKPDGSTRYRPGRPWLEGR